MKVKNAIFYFIITSLSIFGQGCQEFISSNTQSQLHKTNITISGIINDIYNNTAVYEASITFGKDYQTFSDVDGRFSILYRLTTDDERNRPVRLQITARNYLPFEQEIIIYPLDYALEIGLIYAAPIIRESVLVLYQFDDFDIPLYVCQALIEDYQGYSDIDSVNAIFFYLNTDTQEIRRLTIPMTLIAPASSRSAYYEATAYPQLESVWEIRTNFDLQATDQSGYSTYVQDMVPPMTGDTPLFPPVFVPPFAGLITIVH